VLVKKDKGKRYDFRVGGQGSMSRSRHGKKRDERGARFKKVPQKKKKKKHPIFPKGKLRTIAMGTQRQGKIWKPQATSKES